MAHQLPHCPSYMKGTKRKDLLLNWKTNGVQSMEKQVLGFSAQKPLATSIKKSP